VGSVSSVSFTTRSTSASRTVRGAPERGLSARPSGRSSRNRVRHLTTAADPHEAPRPRPCWTCLPHRRARFLPAAPWPAASCGAVSNPKAFRAPLQRGSIQLEVVLFFALRSHLYRRTRQRDGWFCIFRLRTLGRSRADQHVARPTALEIEELPLGTIRRLVCSLVLSGEEPPSPLVKHEHRDGACSTDAL